MVAAASLGAALLFVSLDARAQFACGDAAPMDNTVAYNNALLARSTHSRIFGAVETLDREVSPWVSGDTEGALALYYGFSAVLDAVRVPTYFEGGQCGNEFGYGMRSYDLNAFNFAMEGRYGFLTFYYSASGTSGYFVDGAESRARGATINGLAGVLYSVGSFAFRSSQRFDESKYEGTTLDFLIGTGVLTSVGEVRVGYLASQGLYTSVTQPTVRAFVTSVVDEDFGRVPFLKTGLHSLRGIVPAIPEPAGITSMYARKIQFPSAGVVDPNNLDVGLGAPDAIDFWTAHLRQLDVMQLLDADLAVAITPTPLLHVARVGVHTPELNGAERLLDGAEDEACDSVGAGLFVGATTMPKMYYYGVDGGTLPTVTAEVRGCMDPGMVQMHARYNDPDTLAQFPYAAGSWSVSWAVGLMAR